MGLAELVLLAVGLSVDAFAVSICKGLGMKKINLKVAVVLGLFFGGFQAGMPVIGWALGSQFMGIIGPIDHWIAFILLAFIGGKMLWEAFTEDEDEGDGKDAEKIDLVEYLLLAIATSIDALAVGISFAALSVDIVPAVSLIGITTFIFSVAGVAIGHTFGARYEKPATIVGGVVLILIGLKILLEHLGFWRCKTPFKTKRPGKASCRVLHEAFSCRLLHVILICKSLHVRRSPWIPFPSPHRAKLASTCARHAMLRVSPVQPSLKKPVFRSACSHRSSWEMPRVFGSTSCWRFSVLSDWH